MTHAEVRLGDCLEVMRAMPDNSVDSIVTDPPYGLAFLGKKWDHAVPSEDIWREALRVLKPGGHLLAFFGSRTYHRGTVRIEDAGFEIRDQIMWVTGSGFPKGHNLSGEWNGWGTSLKPSHEPIVVARKPLAGTVVQNVESYGTGALNIDGCRIGDGSDRTSGGVLQGPMPQPMSWGMEGKERTERASGGRWPANFIHDGSEEVLNLFPASEARGGGAKNRSAAPGVVFSGPTGGQPKTVRSDSGSAARFFYCAKASQKDRGEGNTHVTVKPTDLMRYLCRLVTPPGGTVLDPFAGSGSTGKAAVLEGFSFIGIELDPDYHAIASQRITASQPALLETA